MSHDSVIADLKSLLKTRASELTPSQHATHVSGESDRAKMILSAAMVEDFLVHALEWKMPDANSDELQRLFHYEGPLGSFSNRIRFAHALGIIDRPTKRRIEIVKELRNAAAHASIEMNFDTPQVRAAVISLLPPALRAEGEKLDRRQLSFVHAALCTSYANEAVGSDRRISPEEILQVAQERPSPDK